MTVRDLWKKTCGWLKKAFLPISDNDHPILNSEGLISSSSAPTSPTEEKTSATAEDAVAVKAAYPSDKNQSLEKIQAGFDNLIHQLQTINDNLGQHLSQQQDLTERLGKIPVLLENFPVIVENQKQLIERTLEQLDAIAVRNQQFISAVEKIPAETVKQTHTLVEINRQLTAAAEVDAQVTDSFNRFNEMLHKLGKSTDNQSESINQMSKTFATSDRYLKRLMAIQNKRFMWAFIITITVCLAAVLILAGVIIYLRR